MTFKKINYISCIADQDASVCNYSLNYKIIHSDFEFEIKVRDLPSLTFMQHSALILSSIFIEYENIGLSYHDVISNLFKCNLYLCERCNLSFEELLSAQHNERYFCDINEFFEKHKPFI